MPDIEVVSKASALDLIALYKTRSDQEGGGGLLPKVRVTSVTGNTVTMTKGNTTLTATENNGVWEFTIPSYGEWTITAVNTTNLQATRTVNVDAVKIYEVDCSTPLRYGYRISKNESDPSACVEYLYDAVGMTPAKMDFDSDSATFGTFLYGDWQNVWFVKNNKPCMLKSNGTVDYYLDPNDYTKKEDGVTASDVANTSYNGNAMAQFPLCWVYRYEDENYYYEIVSDQQVDANYKAYAHTRADGTIADYFYLAMFGASGNSSKLRSISGQSLSYNSSNYEGLTTEQQISGATANGSGWYINSWSRRELVRTLLILIGKSTDTQTVFGNGYADVSLGDNIVLLQTGTLNNKGQFYGYTSNNQQVKVFHVEGLWGDQFDRTAGVISSNGKIYVKMTPEGNGYRLTDTTGYIDTNITISGAHSREYISQAICNQYGMIPIAVGGSSSTYFCDMFWGNDSNINYLYCGGCAKSPDYGVGIFTISLGDTAALTFWTVGCHLSFA